MNSPKFRRVVRYARFRDLSATSVKRSTGPPLKEQDKLKKGTNMAPKKKTTLPFAVKLKMEELEEDKLAVKMLDMWEPAPPLISPILGSDVKKN